MSPFKIIALLALAPIAFHVHATEKIKMVEKVIFIAEVEHIDAANKAVDIFLNRFKREDIEKIVLTETPTHIKVSIGVRGHSKISNKEPTRGGGEMQLVVTFLRHPALSVQSSDFFLQR